MDDRDDKSGVRMKTLLVLTFAIGVAVGHPGIRDSFHYEQAVTQSCVDSHAIVVFFDRIEVDHPLGQYACGTDIHRIEKLGLETEGPDITMRGKK